MKIFVRVSAFLCILLCCANKSSQGNHPLVYALSPVYLQYLEDVETRFYKFLRERPVVGTEDSQRWIAIQRYLTEYDDSVRRNTNTTWKGENGSEISSKKQDVSLNPILSLQMINRFVKYFRNSRIYSVAPSVIIDPNTLPNGKDVEDAMEALLRVQNFYDLRAHQLADGILHGIPTNAHLNARECFELGKLAQENTYFTLALQWFDVTLQKLQNTNKQSDPSLTGLKKDKIISYIKDTIEEHNEDFEESIQNGDMYSFSEPIYSGNYSEIAHLSLRKLLERELEGKVFDQKHPRYNRAIEANMMALCDGKNLQPEKLKARLKCYFDTSRHPYWRINPLKIEELNEKPRIIQIYNIFSDAWIAYLKIKSYTALERAPQPPEATPRTAAYAWFEDAAIPDIPVSKTVEFITGLNVIKKGAAEELQVAAYAFGGHVAPHHDSFYLGESDEPAYNTSGNQLTTFLAYVRDATVIYDYNMQQMVVPEELNQVEKGGRTAFPLLGMSIKPVKNSAVLWYTKLKNGDVDNRTLHAACPVVIGHKWIVTKWTRIGENFLKRPCGLRPDE